MNHETGSETSLEEQLKRWVEILDSPMDIVRSLVKDHKYHDLVQETTKESLLDTSNEVFTLITGAFIHCDNTNLQDNIDKVKGIKIPKHVYPEISKRIVAVVNSVKLTSTGANKSMYSQLLTHVDPDFTEYFFNEYPFEAMSAETLDFIGNCYLEHQLDEDQFKDLVFKAEIRVILGFLNRYKEQLDRELVSTCLCVIKDKYPKDIAFGMNRFNIVNIEKYLG